MRLIKSLTVALCVFGVAGCMQDTATGGGQQAKRQVPWDETFTSFGLASSTDREAYLALYKVVEFDGQLELCGVSKISSNLDAGIKRELLRNIRLTANGRPVANDINFFTRITARDHPRLVLATCKPINLQAGPDYEFDLVLGKSSFAT
ncbi:hypothetical protein [Actibacterium sp. XHP0104]|uniref:hypothetical protein n=1 Tax=Actibacterium sp. XHP0104 TaxID=2984335 RepID=UPI0021E892A5|nr:hypothetical protein [Actibacterium sp. XHP0104]MCV2881371.1 hypothetical protein [Actibacterium sp. XHP0104]